MTLEQAECMVERIKEAKNYDPEKAHALEDELYTKFARHVASCKGWDVTGLEELAKIVLKTKRLKFPRWTA
jgi:hypothetical protein